MENTITLTPEELLTFATELLNSKKTITTDNLPNYIDTYFFASTELIASANREHEEYFIDDPIWPSRKWNANRTDYIDLSGEELNDNSVNSTEWN